MRGREWDVRTLICWSAEWSWRCKDTSSELDAAPGGTWGEPAVMSDRCPWSSVLGVLRVSLAEAPLEPSLIVLRATFSVASGKGGV